MGLGRFAEANPNATQLLGYAAQGLSYALMGPVAALRDMASQAILGPVLDEARDYAIERISGFYQSKGVTAENAGVLASGTLFGVEAAAGRVTSAVAGAKQYAVQVSGAKATGQIVPGVISPTYRDLQGLNKGFQAHHTLPQYLGKMLGHTKNDMLDHPATLITQHSHTGKMNPDAMHKAISKYLPPMVGGKPARYTAEQISSGLQKAYDDIGRPELFDSIKHLIK
ncbi:hypothetical protein ACNFIC_21120 [Pseudomonas sp. NY15463]|uniref:hypothetical protein n=1 Tax=Pseudomonas sp. NY15463 TaxID=3400361 RepID=UPI003A85A845